MCIFQRTINIIFFGIKYIRSDMSSRIWILSLSHCIIVLFGSFNRVKIISASKYEAYSLVFVFDVTGSMTSELDQVKIEAKKILITLSNQHERFVQDYIFIPFNDPNIGPLVSTTSLRYFEMIIQNITVTGGGDCPEMSLTAIRQGLNFSRPKSHIFVFTDADPKDKDVLADVVSLIRQKQSQVTFLLTGNCEENNYPIEYKKVATTSTGQIFSLQKTDIHKVTEIFSSSFYISKVNLLAVDVQSYDPSSIIYNVTIDETITNLTVSVSGEKVNVDGVFQEDRKHDRKSNQAIWLLDMQSVKIIKIEAPLTGTWNVIISSKSFYSLRLRGSSVLSFIYGFSIQWTRNMTETISLPFGGVKNHMLVEAQGIYIDKLSTCELITLDGSSMFTIPLQLIRNSSSLYYGSFTPNDTDFHLQISGITKKGNMFRRLTYSTLRSNDSAILIIAPKHVIIDGYNNYSLHCKISSLKPFEASWLKNGTPIAAKKLFNTITGKISIEFRSAYPKDAGNYTCFVRRQEDVISKTSVVRYFEKPVLMMRNDLPDRIELPLFADYELSCLVKGYPEPKITWKFNSSIKIDGAFLNDHQMILPNNSLLLMNALTNQSGIYECVAENESGNDFRIYDVLISNNSNYTQVVKSMEGDKAILNCPEGRNVQWLKDGNLLDIRANERADEPRFILKGLKLKIVGVDIFDMGIYACSFTNSSGHYLWPFILQVMVPLSITNGKTFQKVLVKEQDNIILDCNIEGYPLPMITWKKKDFGWPVNAWTMANVSFDNVKKQLLKISSFSKVHAGEYECIAENEISVVRKYFKLLL